MEKSRINKRKKLTIYKNIKGTDLDITYLMFIYF